MKKHHKVFPNRNVRKNINYNLLKWPVMILTIGIAWFYTPLDKSYLTYSGSWIYYRFQSQKKIYWVWVNVTFRSLSDISFNIFWIRLSSIQILMKWFHAPILQLLIFKSPPSKFPLTRSMPDTLSKIHCIRGWIIFIPNRAL